MLITMEGPAVTQLNDFIHKLRTNRTPTPTFFMDLHNLEIVLRELVEREEELVRLDEILARWLTEVPGDFAKPTFEQIAAHLLAIDLGLSAAFYRASRARNLSQELRPPELRDNEFFLRDFLSARVIEGDVLPSADLRRAGFEEIADLLLRAGVLPVTDVEMTAGEFEALPVHRFVLELYIRTRSHRATSKESEHSLEFKLLKSGAYARLCRQRKGLLEFLGPQGLDLYSEEGGWRRFRRWLRRQWLEITRGTKSSALYSEYLLVLIFVLVDVYLFVFLWNPHLHRAEEDVARAKSQMIQSVIPPSASVRTGSE